MRRDRAQSGFTLIELLVVLAIITLLISILAPALSQVRTVAQQLREVAQGQQQIVAFHSYATDMNDKLMPGYLAWDWAHPGPDAMLPPDEGGRLMEGTAVKRYPLRLSPWFDYDMRAIIGDKRQYEEVNALPRQQANPGALVVPGGGSHEWAVAQNPTFGMNSTFVGGDWIRGGFRQGNLRRYGKFYVAEMSDARQPSRLTAFASARGSNALFGQNEAPGWFRVDPPFAVSNPTGGWLRNGENTIVNFNRVPLVGFRNGTYDETLDPGLWGNMAFRWLDKAVIVHLDGHVENLGVSDMYDMRRWWDGAANWRSYPTPR